MLDITEYRRLEEQGESWLRRKHRRLPRMDREELLQDSLIQLVRHMESHRVTNPGGLLGTIIDQKAIDFTRRSVRRDAVEFATPDLSAVSPVALQTYDDLIFAVTLDQTLRAMPPTLRDTFILTDIRGLTSTEASLLLHRPASTVRNHRDEARNLIRKELQ
jgi:DNA-directed RNA polymerase specialized sigma24 family protein